MSKILARQSIKTKLTLLIMAISVVLLLIVSVAVLVAEVFATRTALVQELRLLSAALTATSRQPLVLGQYEEAESVLTALGTQKHIHAAYLFNAEGEPVAEYLSQDNSLLVWKSLERDFSPANLDYWSSAPTEGISSSLTHLGIFSPIFFEGTRVGALYLLSDLNSLYGRLSGVAFGITLSLMFLFVCSWYLAGRLQKPISEPLLELAAIMERVSVQRDYSQRAHRRTNDEIALLVDGLNHMLEQVEQHQQQQLQLQGQLELTVDQRTAELRAAVVELEKARRQADAANDAKSHFLSRMTHELRTPLIGVLGMNGLLQRTPLTEQQRMLVETVGKSGEDLLALISDVLDLARIEAGKLDLDSEEIEPAQIVEEVVELLAPQAQIKGVVLLADIPIEAICRARGDRAKIWQILMNLIGNAIKFTPAGEVRASLEVVPEAEGRGRFVIKVEDTGIGMDAVTCQYVFDLFYQHQGLTSEINSGSGLGLPIVKQLVDLMAGNLSLTSHPGKGSCFKVELCLPLLGRSLRPVSAELSGSRILLGIESSAQGQLLCRQLEDLGFKVTWAGSVAEVITALEALRLKDAPCRVLFLAHQWYSSVQLMCADQNLSELAPQIALLCPGSQDYLPMGGSVSHLYQPVTWNRLHEFLSRVSVNSEKRIVPLPAVSRTGSTSGAEEGRVVFVGRHAALRQLLRLSLARRHIGVDAVVDLREALLVVQTHPCLMLMIDCADVSIDTLEHTLAAAGGDFPPCYLLCDQEPDVDAIKGSVIKGYLMKPLDSNALNGIFDQLPAQRHNTELSAAAGMED